MRFRFAPQVVLVLVAIVAGVAIFGAAFLRARANSTANLLGRLPADDAVIVFLDFEKLRSAGILELLAESSLVQEPEYRNFVEESGFDYRRDLESALISFHHDGTFFLLRGSFNWPMLNSFVERQGGDCYNVFCRAQGSTPERKISYFPIQRNIMALAVGKNDMAASRLQARRSDLAGIEIPDQPVWSLIPSSYLKSHGNLPGGTRLFADVLAGADRVIISAGPDGQRLGVFLDVTCRSQEDASILRKQMSDLTDRLRELLAREKAIPDARDLSGLLAGGEFEQHDRRVLGRWPLDPALLETLAGSAL